MPAKTPLISFFILFCTLFTFHSFSQADSFFVAGIHPAATLQPTVTGKGVMTLFPWNGKLYSGYGDYGANTGPIDIYSFSPDSLTFTYEAEANTEAIYNYRAINGMLYAPSIDRKSYAMPGDYVKLDSAGNWANYNFGSASTHTYDAARLNDSILYMAGSQEEKATVWKSINNGLTWTKILSDTAVSGIAGDFARFYFAGVYNNKLYVQARDYYGPLHPKSKIYDGTTWIEGPSLFPSLNPLGWRPEEFANKLVLRSWEAGSSSLLVFFDGNNSISSGLYVVDGLIDSIFYYALVDAGFGVKNLRRTTDLVHWENLLIVPFESRSFAILDDKLFIGTRDSEILQYTKPVSLLASPTSFEISNLNKFQITIHPNPAADFIHLTFKEALDDFEIEIINTSGYIIFKTKNSTQLDVSGLSAGVYFLKIIKDGNFIIQEFFKE